MSRLAARIAALEGRRILGHANDTYSEREDLDAEFGVLVRQMTLDQLIQLRDEMVRLGVLTGEQAGCA